MIGYASDMKIATPHAEVVHWREESFRSERDRPSCDPKPYKEPLSFSVSRRAAGETPARRCAKTGFSEF